MSKDKYLCTFSHQMEAIAFIIVQILFAKCAIFKILGKKSLRYYPVFAGEYLNIWVIISLIFSSY